jgi:hypothetical protein
MALASLWGARLGIFDLAGDVYLTSEGAMVEQKLFLKSYFSKEDEYCAEVRRSMRVGQSPTPLLPQSIAVIGRFY